MALSPYRLHNLRMHEFTPALALPAGAQVRVDVFISFGGLLMQLTGDPSKLEDLAVDSQVYLLMRKV